MEVVGVVITTPSEATNNDAVVMGAFKAAMVGRLASTGIHVVEAPTATAPMFAVTASRADAVEVTPETVPTSATIDTMCGTTGVDETDAPPATAPTTGDKMLRVTTADTPPATAPALPTSTSLSVSGVALVATTPTRTAYAISAVEIDAPADTAPTNPLMTSEVLIAVAPRDTTPTRVWLSLEIASAVIDPVDTEPTVWPSLERTVEVDATPDTEPIFPAYVSSSFSTVVGATTIPTGPTRTAWAREVDDPAATAPALPTRVTDCVMTAPDVNGPPNPNIVKVTGGATALGGCPKSVICTVGSDGNGVGTPRMMILAGVASHAYSFMLVGEGEVGVVCGVTAAMTNVVGEGTARTETGHNVTVVCGFTTGAGMASIVITTAPSTPAAAMGLMMIFDGVGSHTAQIMSAGFGPDDGAGKETGARTMSCCPAIYVPSRLVGIRVLTVVPARRPDAS